MGKPRKVSRYQEFQKQMLRDELVAVKARLELDKNETLSWSKFNVDVMEDVRDFYNQFPERVPDVTPARARAEREYIKVTDHFRQFAVGARNKTGEIEDLPDYQLISIEIWLTEITLKYSELTQDMLHPYPGDIRESVVVANYLNIGARSLPQLGTSKFQSTYEGERILHLDSKGIRQCKSQLVLFLKVHDQHAHVLSIRLIETRHLIKPPGDDATLESLGLSQRSDREGWLAISHESNTCLFLKDKYTNENYSPVTIGLDDNAYEADAMIERMALLIQQEDPVSITKNHSQELMTIWAEENVPNLVLLYAK